MVRVSVHIANRDRASELCALLHSLRAQTFQDFDVMILDDGSGTPAEFNNKFVHDVIGRLRLEGHGVRFLRNNFSLGVCRARQRLVDEDLWKENEYVLRVDDDNVLSADYLERLVKIMQDHPECGIVSGVTPMMCGPDLVREVIFVEPVINKIVLNAEGDVTYYGDDCGCLYDESKVLRAHQFRSNALIRREVFSKVSYEQGLSMTGFREELFVSLRAMLAGWTVLVDTGAVSWHAHALSGGCRAQDYEARVQLDHEKAMNWIKDNKDKLKEVLV